METLFATQRSLVLKNYNDIGQKYIAGTKPYKSSAAFNFFNVQSFGATALLAGSAGILVARAGQRVEWFTYGIGQVVQNTATSFTPPGTTNTPIVAQNALEDDTNLSKPRSTNGTEDFIIEGISATARSTRMAWLAADVTAMNALMGNQSSGAAVSVDADVVNLQNGVIPLLDPAALLAPPQVHSPINLEAVLMQALAPHIVIEFEWDRGRVEKIGTLDQIPEGGAKSFLRSHGDPRTDNRYRIPEGYVWRRDGQPDSEFIVRGTLLRSVAVPISGITFPSGVSGTPTGRMPALLSLDVVVRLHGLAIKLPSRN